MTSQSSCSAACKGTTEDGFAYDLSALMGQDYQTVGLGDTYFLNVCGMSATECPSDAGDPPVTQGTAVSTVSSGGCYVLGVRFTFHVLSVVLSLLITYGFFFFFFNVTTTEIYWR